MEQSKSKTLIMHLGYGKCASTYIQHLASLSKEHLAKAGIKFSQSGLIGFANHCLSVNYCTQCATEHQHKVAKKTLCQELGALQAGETLLVSSEYLVGDPKSALEEILKEVPKDINVQLIIFLRRQDRLIESWYSQEIQNANYMDKSVMRLGEALWDIGILSYGKFVEEINGFSQQHGAELSVYSLEQLHDANIDPLLAMLASTNVDSIKANILDQKAFVLRNKSLTYESLMLLRFIHNECGLSLFKMFMNEWPEWFPLKGRSSYLSDAERRLIIAQSAESNTLLTHQYPTCLFDEFQPASDLSSRVVRGDENKDYIDIVSAYADLTMEWLSNYNRNGETLH
jgi:hypothetical protein